MAQHSSESSEDIDNLIAELNADHVDFLDSKPEKPTARETSEIPERWLETGAECGLTIMEVEERGKKFGLNQLKEEKENMTLKFLGYFRGRVQSVMEIAVILGIILHHWTDVSVICGLLLLNAVVGFGQEYRAGSTIDALKKTLALKATVVRAGQTQDIEARYIVPGDIVQIGEGAIVPADGRVITEGAYLQVDQSALTGESLPADKQLGDTCFSSSMVKRGEATLIITCIGDSTRVGRTAASVGSKSMGTGHFTKVLNQIGTVLLALVALTFVVVVVSMLFRNQGLHQILEQLLQIAIIGVPVGLPVVVTTTMVVGASYLSKKQAAVQQLSAIESLAGVDILCSDKTGTLTKNELTLYEPYCVSGIERETLMLTACLTTTRKKNGIDAIDKAFLKALVSYPEAKASLSKYKIIEFQPFDPVSKKVTVMVESPEGERITCVKGSPLPVLSHISRDHYISAETEREYKKTVSEFATRGLRSLGIARKRGEGKWEILGIMPCMDPPRHDTAQTIAEAQSLGLSVKMLTGDAVGIARETSRQLGLGTNVYNAEMLGLSGNGNMPGSEISDFVEAADGFAEVFPDHKYGVVEVLQNRGHLVAMTGDGVNDASALKKADTGIAVQGASEAARSAADIVFLAPGLSAIIDAIKTSRQIFHRMYAYIVYRIALSVHLEIYLASHIAVYKYGLEVQYVLLIAVCADIATLAVAYDNATFDRKPVKWNLPGVWKMSVVLGIILAAGTWILLAIMKFNPVSTALLPQHPRSPLDSLRIGSEGSLLFLEIVLTQNWLIFITRSKGLFWSSPPSWKLFVAVLTVDIVATVVCFMNWFGPEPRLHTHWHALIIVWLYSLCVFCVMGVVHNLLQNRTWLRGVRPEISIKWTKPNEKAEKKQQTKKRDNENFVASMRRVSVDHERVARH